MKINFESTNQNQNVDNSKITYSAPYTRSIRVQRGFQLDISGAVMDNKAYGGQGMTTEDVMSKIGNLDITNKRNYMAIMSNSMSAKDLEKLEEEGFHPGSMDVEKVVTVVDEIKAKLAEAGIEIAGYTDDLSVEELTRITKNAGYAVSIARKFNEYNVPVTKENVTEAMKEFERAGEIKELSDGAMKYMVVNKKPPTIDNIYIAQFSAAKNGDMQGMGYFADDMTGYYGRKANDIHFDRLQGQMEKVIEDAGLVVYKDTLNQAKWLVEKGIPLTKDNLSLLNELKEISFPKTSDEIMNAIAAALSEGKAAGDAFLSSREGALEKAISICDIVSTITEAAIEKVYAQGKPFSIRNLNKAEKELSLSVTEKNDVFKTTDSNTPALTSAKRQLEEIRLHMTVQANYKLIKSGFSIDTAELEKVVEQLKNQEQMQRKVMFGDLEEGILEEKAALYTEVTDKLSAIREMPAAVVGRVAVTRSVFTLNYVHTQATVLKSSYEGAGQSYEALMTAPRQDLGDSIKKAFGRIKVLLEDLGIEYNEENAKAVRILGYNQMEITEDNINAVKTANNALTRVVEKMTPSAVLHMIREDVNPLNKNIEDLYDYLKEIEKETVTETEKYSKYLYKLEKSDSISEEEREAYIGIYRLFRQIEKNDGAAIGSLLQTGRELSLANLLGEVRTRKRGSFQAQVDDDHGSVSEVTDTDTSISRQIERYYKRKADHIFERLSPERFSTADITGEVTLEQLDEQLSGQSEKEQLESEYLKDKLQDMRKINRVDDTVIETLLEYGSPLSVDNLMAADYLMNYRGATFKQLASYAAKNDRATSRATTSEKTLVKRLDDNLEQIKDAMTDKDDMQEAYGEFIETARDILEKSAFEEGAAAIDVKSMAIFSKQLTFLENMAKEENYEVPVKLGDEFTSIHIKILRNRKEKGKVTASLETEAYGRVAASFEAEDERISGCVGCSTPEGFELLKQKENLLCGQIQSETKKEAKIQLVFSKNIDMEGFGHRKEVDTQASTKELYHIAKAFISFMEK